MSKMWYDVEHLNWSKGPTALETMTCSLYNYTRGTWKKNITEWSEDEQKRIPSFINHVKTDQISGNHVKTDQISGMKDKIKKFAWKCNCRDGLCQNIISRLVDNHQNSGSRKFVWKIDESTEQYEDPEDYYWELAKMFMLNGTEKTKEVCTKPEDTDLTLILKMMKNCKLFHLSDNGLYDEVLGVRNSLMHSSVYKISFNTLKEYFDIMDSFLDTIKEKDDVDPKYKLEIENAQRELNSLLWKKVRIELTIDELDSIRKALEFQQKAIQRDLHFSGVTSRAPEELNEHLLSSQRQVKHYTIIINEYRPALSIVDAIARKKAIEAIEKRFKEADMERKQKEEQLRLDIEKRKKQEEEERIQKEVDRRIRELERLHDEERRQRAKEERRQREDEERERKKKDEENKVGAGVGAFTAGAAAGAVLGPVGAVVGGTLGAIFGARAK